MKIPDKAIRPGVKVHVLDSLKALDIEVAGTFAKVTYVDYNFRYATLDSMNDVKFSLDCFDAIEGVKYV